MTGVATSRLGRYLLQQLHAGVLTHAPCCRLHRWGTEAGASGATPPLLPAAAGSFGGRGGQRRAWQRFAGA